MGSRRARQAVVSRGGVSRNRRRRRGPVVYEPTDRVRRGGRARRHPGRSLRRGAVAARAAGARRRRGDDDDARHRERRSRAGGVVGPVPVLRKRRRRATSKTRQPSRRRRPPLHRAAAASIARGRRRRFSCTLLAVDAGPIFSTARVRVADVRARVAGGKLRRRSRDARRGDSPRRGQRLDGDSRSRRLPQRHPRDVTRLEPSLERCSPARRPFARPRLSRRASGAVASGRARPRASPSPRPRL